MFIMLYYLAEQVSAEKELSDWFPERSDFFLYGKDLTKSRFGKILEERTVYYEVVILFLLSRL